MLGRAKTWVMSEAEEKQWAEKVSPMVAPEGACSLVAYKKVHGWVWSLFHSYDPWRMVCFRFPDGKLIPCGKDEPWSPRGWTIDMEKPIVNGVVK